MFTSLQERTEGLDMVKILLVRETLQCTAVQLSNFLRPLSLTRACIGFDGSKTIGYRFPRIPPLPKFMEVMPENSGFFLFI
jgi:hypothetical protein